MVVPSFWKVTITWVFHYEEFEAQGEVNLPRAASHYYQAFFPALFWVKESKLKICESELKGGKNSKVTALKSFWWVGGPAIIRSALVLFEF